jgi:hypothetical protein
MYHKDAFTFVTADLPIMDDAHKCVRKTMDGLSMRVWMASDIRNDELLRACLDMLYGFKTTAARLTKSSTWGPSRRTRTTPQSFESPMARSRRS